MGEEPVTRSHQSLASGMGAISGAVMVRSSMRLGFGPMSRHGLSMEEHLRVARIFKKVPNVGTGDSSSSSETEVASLGLDLHNLQKAFNFLTWLLFRMPVEINMFIESIPFSVPWWPRMGCLSVEIEWRMCQEPGGPFQGLPVDKIDSQSC